jgi:hypothetical protein
MLEIPIDVERLYFYCTQKEKETIHKWLTTRSNVEDVLQVTNHLAIRLSKVPVVGPWSTSDVRCAAWTAWFIKNIDVYEIDVYEEIKFPLLLIPVFTGRTRDDKLLQERSN